ncbi:hypothetical protein MPSI1_000543 [Malassezia psittaci]|uniref:Uncharacterized protein n=1 Tax=Malassezia psittaci TaxID=1821823 RepID=A0AAF0F8X4_9BASI|nr:hypothetical protein MPSI1_000543 [Malassezia psittaci]
MRIQVHAGEELEARLDDLPQPLARLSPSGELVMIELQGSLEMDGVDPEGGQTIGKLQFHPGCEDKPVLQISHHLLEGKIVKLAKPIAILKKQVMPSSIEESDGENESPTPPTSPGPASPSQLAKRARYEAKTPPRPTTKDLDSSPMPERALRYSDGHMDFSSPQTDRFKKPPTTTSYQVVTIIRQKILFSKHPEPIV